MSDSIRPGKTVAAGGVYGRDDPSAPTEVGAGFHFKEEERQELKHRMEQLLPELAGAKTMPITEAESNFYRMYSGFGGALLDILNQNNQVLLEKMDERISNRILKEMNFLFRERENLEEERYRKLDRTIRECQVARQRFSLEEERKKKFRWK